MKIKEREKIVKYLDLARELKKPEEHEGDGETYDSWSPWNSLQRPGKKTAGTEDQRQNRDHPDHSTVKICKNYLKESWRPEETCSHSDFAEKPPAKFGVKNAHRVNRIIINKVKLATVVEGNQKASFLIATTPRYGGGHNSFPWIVPLYPRYVPYIAEC